MGAALVTEGEYNSILGYTPAIVFSIARVYIKVYPRNRLLDSFSWSKSLTPSTLERYHFHQASSIQECRVDQNQKSRFFAWRHLWTPSSSVESRTYDRDSSTKALDHGATNPLQPTTEPFDTKSSRTWVHDFMSHYYSITHIN